MKYILYVVIIECTVLSVFSHTEEASRLTPSCKMSEMLRRLLVSSGFKGLGFIPSFEAVLTTGVGVVQVQAIELVEPLLALPLQGTCPGLRAQATGLSKLPKLESTQRKLRLGSKTASRPIGFKEVGSIL